MNKALTYTPIAIALIVMAFTTIQQQAQASTLFNYAQGNDDGIQAAKNNFPSGDASCPQDYFSHIVYCTGYHVGYNYEWTLLQAAGVSK